jgi:hypothetical protein
MQIYLVETLAVGVLIWYSLYLKALLYLTLLKDNFYALGVT